jgi:hypothetical protein
MEGDRPFVGPEGVRIKSLGARGLTSAQRAFAERNDVIAWRRSTRSPTAVFMYRDEPHRAFRWLVDEDGRVIESEAFRREGDAADEPPPTTPADA